MLGFDPQLAYISNWLNVPFPIYRTPSPARGEVDRIVDELLSVFMKSTSTSMGVLALWTREVYLLALRIELGSEKSSTAQGHGMQAQSLSQDLPAERAAPSNPHGAGAADPRERLRNTVFGFSGLVEHVAL